MIVMGVESSCDETGVGIVRWNGDGTCELLADEVHRAWISTPGTGEWFPKWASRAHLEAIVPTMRRALAAAGIEKPDALAVTIGPGLAGALLVGVAAAKAYAAAWNIPFLCGQSSRRSRLGGHSRARSVALVRRIVGLRRSHTPASRRRSGQAHCRTGHDCRRRRRVRPSTRWPDCSDSAFPVDRHSMLLRKREIGTQSPSLAA